MKTPTLLALATFGLFAAWSLVVPINEAPDEIAHWQYARYLHDHWSLPPYGPAFEEANSPPLAYLLFAPLAFDDASPDGALSYRPDGSLVSFAEPRRFLNTGEAFTAFWPQRFARLLAAAVSTLTVYLVWRAGCAAGDAHVGLLAALFVAFLPMFSFRAGHVSNDASLACACAAATLGFVHLLRSPYSSRVAWWTSAAVGVAYMSKISAIAMVPPFALALLLADPPTAWRTRARRLLVLSLAAGIVAPWSIRNVALYGDPFASEAMREAVAHIITDRPLLSPFFVNELPRLLTKSFIGIFGWGNITMPTAFYLPYVLLFVVSFAGTALGMLRGRIDARLASVLAVTALAALAVVVRINLQFTQLQGRYLLPALPAVSILVALGLRTLSGSWIASPTFVGVTMLAGNIYALVAMVVPSYYPAPIRTLPSGERVMVPSLLEDMAVLDGQGHWVVTGPRPSWLAHVDARASRFQAFEVTAMASAGRATQRACITPTLAVQRSPVPQSSCVDWIADGRPHLLRFPLQGLETWRGVVTHLRLDPIAEGGMSSGAEIWTRAPRLVP